MLSLLAAILLAASAAHASFSFKDPGPLSGPTDVPMALTASDGTGLILERIEADVVLEGPLAFTQLHLVFKNPVPRTIEGRFKITLPEGAALSRFAMKIGKHWQEGEVLEKSRARRVYEDFLHRRQDPALLEQAAGNLFTARVFSDSGVRTKRTADQL